MSFDEAFRSYKADLIVKGSATLDTFNGVNGVGENNFFHNDSWCTEVMGSMLSLTETIEEIISFSFTNTYLKRLYFHSNTLNTSIPLYDQI